MGFFDSIKNAIFGGPAKAEEAPAAAPTPTAGAPAATAPASTPAAAPAPATPIPTPAPTTTAQAPAAANVDVAAILDQAVKAKKQKLNWRTSIVDLMKALDIDSGLKARKALAEELGYTGDMGDSAKMNIWLHKQVIKKLAENGGKVPADLLD